MGALLGNPRNRRHTAPQGKAKNARSAGRSYNCFGAYLFGKQKHGGLRGQDGEIEAGVVAFVGINQPSLFQPLEPVTR